MWMKWRVSFWKRDRFLHFILQWKQKSRTRITLSLCSIKLKGSLWSCQMTFYFEASKGEIKRVLPFLLHSNFFFLSLFTLIYLSGGSLRDVHVCFASLCSCNKSSGFSLMEIHLHLYEHLHRHLSVPCVRWLLSPAQGGSAYWFLLFTIKAITLLGSAETGGAAGGRPEEAAIGKHNFQPHHTMKLDF